MGMKRILVTDGLEESALNKIKSLGFGVVEEFYERHVLKERIGDFDAVIIRSKTKVTTEILDGAKMKNRLKLIIRAGVGVDNIDISHAKKVGIEVQNTPCASSVSVAELTFGHLLNLARDVAKANEALKQGMWKKNAFIGMEIFGKTIGLIGFGRIANEVAKRAKAFGMNVIYFDINEIVLQEGYTYKGLKELLESSDFISFHIPLPEDNLPILNLENIQYIKKGAFIINTARGGVVCEKALLHAIEKGWVAGAALDVFEKEPLMNEDLRQHPMIYLSPHMGASTFEAQARIGEEVCDILQKFFEKG